MGRWKPSWGILIGAAVLMMLCIEAPVVYGADRVSQHKNASAKVPRLTLPEAVSIAIARNLRMADSRLAIEEKEHQRREAFSDFFPSIDLSYNATWYRYQQ